MIRHACLIFPLLCWLTGAQAAETAPTDIKIIERQPVDYPAVSQRFMEEGRVVVSLQVLKDGSVGAIQVAESSGFIRLDEAAKASVARWKYSAARDASGNPIDSSKLVAVRYQVDYSDQPELAMLSSEEKKLFILWGAYVNHQKLRANMLDNCQIIGISTQAATDLIKKLNTEINIANVETRLKQSFAKAGVADPNAYINQSRQQSEQSAEQFAARILYNWHGEDMVYRCKFLINEVVEGEAEARQRLGLDALKGI